MHFNNETLASTLFNYESTTPTITTPQVDLVEVTPSDPALNPIIQVIDSGLINQRVDTVIEVYK